MGDAPALLLLSFDVEEFDIPLEYERELSLDEQLDVGRRGFERVLDMLEAHPARPVTTLFTTARIATHCPDLMKRAAERHEIASHGFTHEKTLQPGDLERSRACLEELCGVRVRGFRRARFAPTDLGEIARAGYEYNSSEHPTFMPGRYNNLGKPRRAYQARVSGAAPGGVLVQIPVSVAPVIRAPMSWVAFKNFPMWFVRACAARTIASDRVANFLWHPWEFVDISGYGLPWTVRRVQGEHLVRRLERFITFLSRRGRFGTFAEHAAAVRASQDVRESA